MSDPDGPFTIQQLFDFLEKIFAPVGSDYTQVVHN